MRVIEATRFGDPDVLTLAEVPDPLPGPVQVVVRASVADVLFVDTQIRRGRGGRTSLWNRRTCPAAEWLAR